MDCNCFSTRFETFSSKLYGSIISASAFKSSSWDQFHFGVLFSCNPIYPLNRVHISRVCSLLLSLLEKVYFSSLWISIAVEKNPLTQIQINMETSCRNLCCL